MGKLTNINFIHLFVNDKEFSLDALNCLFINYNDSYITLNLKVLNDSSINSVISFFENIDSNILFFIGYNSNEADPILSLSGKYIGNSISKGICSFKFERSYDGDN